MPLLGGEVERGAAEGAYLRVLGWWEDAAFRVYGLTYGKLLIFGFLFKAFLVVNY